MADLLVYNVMLIDRLPEQSSEHYWPSLQERILAKNEDLDAVESQHQLKDELMGGDEATHSRTVLARLRELILSRELRSGEKLQAARLAQKLGVSRTPIVSALSALESQGFVQYSAYRGYSVADFEPQDILDALEVRAALESLGCQQAAQRLSSEQIQALQQLVDQAAELIERNRWDRSIEQQWYELSYQFHRSIAYATRNRFLRNALSLTLVTPTMADTADSDVFLPSKADTTLTFTAPPEYLVVEQRQHEQILKLLRAGEGMRAGALMRELVLQMRDRVLARQKAP